MNYYVIFPDGQKFGPADLNVLQTWVNEGRVTPDMDVEIVETGERMKAMVVTGLTFPAPAQAAARPIRSTLMPPREPRRARPRAPKTPMRNPRNRPARARTTRFITPIKTLTPARVASPAAMMARGTSPSLTSIRRSACCAAARLTSAPLSTPSARPKRGTREPKPPKPWQLSWLLYPQLSPLPSGVPLWRL